MAEPAPSRTEGASDVDVPLFRVQLGGTTLLWPAEDVEAVTAYEAPTPLPRVPVHVLGLVNFDQRALVIVDLRRFLGLAPHGTAPFVRTVVVHAGDLRVGVPVEAALGVTTVPPAARRGTGTVFEGRLAEVLVAECDLKEGPGAWIDLEKALEAARA